MWGGYAIVGGHLPLAAGIALKVKYMEEDGFVLCFLGDGASNNGYFHESVNLSAVWDLPVVWLIENNGVGMGTRIEESSRQTELVKRAVGYGIKEGPRVDGQDVLEVYEAVREAADYAKQHGPVLMESLTYRYKGHGVSDRSFDTRADLAEELHKWQERDPLEVMRGHLNAQFEGIQPELDRIHQEAVAAVDEAVKFAEDSPAPTYEDLINNVYVK
jgi:pyruvate dehydrogenase E1 component alpha subunit